MTTGPTGAQAALESFPSTWKRVMTDPHGFVADLAETGGLQEPFAFLALAAGANALGHLLFGVGLLGAVALFVWQLVAAGVLAAILVLVAQHLFDGRGGFESTFRVVAYAGAPLALAWVPLVGALALVYAAYLVLRGLERMQRLDTTRAALTLVVGVGVLWILRAVRPGAWL